MSSSFLDRRSEKLAQEGREDLARELARRAAEVPPVPSVVEISEPEDGFGDGDEAEIIEASESDPRSSSEVVDFVKRILDNFDFHASRTAIAAAEREVADMTFRQRQQALRAATQHGIQVKPIYYSILLKRTDAELKSFYKEMVRKVAHLDKIFGRYFDGRTFFARPEDTARVAAMSRAEIQEVLNGVTDGDVRGRGSFYKAILDRLIEKI